MKKFYPVLWLFISACASWGSAVEQGGLPQNNESDLKRTDALTLLSQMNPKSTVRFEGAFSNQRITATSCDDPNAVGANQYKPSETTTAVAYVEVEVKKVSDIDCGSLIFSAPYCPNSFGQAAPPLLRLTHPVQDETPISFKVPSHMTFNTANNPQCLRPLSGLNISTVDRLGLSYAWDKGLAKMKVKVYAPWLSDERGSGNNNSLLCDSFPMSPFLSRPFQEMRKARSYIEGVLCPTGTTSPLLSSPCVSLAFEYYYFVPRLVFEIAPE